MKADAGLPLRNRCHRMGPKSGQHAQSSERPPASHPLPKPRLPSRHKWDIPGFASITGTASGVYKGCATTFTTNGAAGVALLNIYQDPLVALKIFIDEGQSKSGRHLCRLDTHTVDVTNEQAVTQIIENTARTFNRLDYIIIAAGIAFKHEDSAAFPYTSH
ncbi:hypothetical protein BDR22DRAFT_884294 [Usnea florida]